MWSLREREAGSPGNYLLAEELSPRVKTTRRAAVKNRSAHPTTESEYLDSPGPILLSAQSSRALTQPKQTEKGVCHTCASVPVFVYQSPVDEVYLCQQTSRGQRWKPHLLHSASMS